MSTFYQLPDIGQPITILTHFLVRDEAQLLYGFSTESERALFRNLLKVSGVGGRVALGILSGISVEGFRRCVLDRDLVTLTRIPGIGRKTAERLMVEMKDRLNITDADALELEPNTADATKPNADAVIVMRHSVSLMTTWHCCTLRNHYLAHHCIHDSPSDCFAMFDQIIQT